MTIDSARMVELPIGASEDRVVGSIDMEAGFGSDAVSFKPGLLAEANRQILYVDEVNLLEDHLVDVLLDVAASGVNLVEREGISVSHPARFILVGTMNAEEGKLRPQLLDRFGLCVDVRGLGDVHRRVQVMEAASQAASASASAADGVLAIRVSRARAVLPRVAVPDRIIRAAVTLGIEQQVAGHRADLILVRAARARRALLEAEREAGAEAAYEVGTEDLDEVAEFVLVHRRRSLGKPATAPVSNRPQPRPVPDPPKAAAQTADQQSLGEGADPGPLRDAQPTAGPTPAIGDGQGAEAGSNPPMVDSGPDPEATPEVAVEEAFRATGIHVPRERVRRRGSGRRSETSARDSRGRYVAARVTERTTDLALDATLRAAAPHQRERHRRAGMGVGDWGTLLLEAWDLRQKIRQRKVGSLIVFAVDASTSMDTAQRMAATRSAILALLRAAYVRRDRVAMVTFSGRTAKMALPPTRSVHLAERELSRIAIGGATPLTIGLVTAFQLIRRERMRDPEVLPLLVFISDGRGNVSVGGEAPLVEARNIADQIGREGIRGLVIDSSRGHSQGGIAGAQAFPGQPARFPARNFNPCLDLAERMGAQYFGLLDVSERAILEPITSALGRRFGAL
ncbi:MAG: VWA domain-containing protein [Candidatus Dormibacteria bacterium]